MNILKCKIIIIVISSLLSCNKQVDNFISKENFNADWNFKLLSNAQIDSIYSQRELNINNWEKISLPHTPRLEPKVVNDQWQGVCWYRKNFSLTEKYKGKQLWLKFEAAMNVAEVWVNGKKLIKHQGGYLPFVVDFTNVAIFDRENIVAVRLDNNDNPITGPKPLNLLDFNTYGGIHRNVWLIAKNSLHITDPILENKTASGGVFVTYPKVTKDSARIKIQTHIKNLDEYEKTFTVRNTLDENGSTIISVESKKQVLDSKRDKEVESTISLNNPALWSPKYPNLYKLKTEILYNGIAVDKEINRIGIKTMAFKGQDFYLNGEKTFLRGVNRHQEYPYVGYALSNNAQYRDAKKIKDAGFDYVRLSHYPHAPAFMDACDELGIMTIDAILGWQYFSEDEIFQKHILQTAKDLIRRDRNHASILAWEVSLNESWMPEHFIDSLTNIAHIEYPSDQCFTAGWQPYGYDIYLQARQHRLKHYNENLKKPYNVSEYGDWEYYAMNAGLNQNSWENLLQENRSSRQLRGTGEVRLLQQATNIQEAHNDNLNTLAFADGYWVMFDYNRGYSNDLEASGIMDLFRLPKPAYYFFQSQRDPSHPFGKPMIYIANNWQSNSPLDIRVFSNCDEVELLVNGISFGQQKPDHNQITNNLNHPPFTFSLDKFQEGELTALGYIDNKLVASHYVKTPQLPTNLNIVVDDNLENLPNEVQDQLFVYAYITDDNGTTVTDYEGEITFDILGEAQLLGENPIKCEAGIANILLMKTEGNSEIKIIAKAKGLGLTKVYNLKLD